MADYPAGIYEPRAKTNKNGIVYDPLKTNVLFAEDITNDDDEIVAIENELGLNPRGGSTDVAARLSLIESTLSDKLDSADAMGYTLYRQGNSQVNPLDNTTYYLDNYGGLTTSQSVRTQIIVPKTGVVTAVYMRIAVEGVLGTAENVNIYLRKNNAGDTLLANDSKWTGAMVTVAATGLTLSVSAGDYLEFKIVCPAWVTNPTKVVPAGVIYIE